MMSLMQMSKAGFGYSTGMAAEARRLKRSGILPENWRRNNNWRSMKVRVGIRVHYDVESGGALSNEFSSAIFSDEEKMKQFALHVRHNLEQSLTQSSAQVEGMVSYAKGGAGTLTWSVDSNSTVIDLYAWVEQDARRVKIVNRANEAQAYVKFHDDLHSSTSSYSTGGAR